MESQHGLGEGGDWVHAVGTLPFWATQLLVRLHWPHRPTFLWPNNSHSDSRPGHMTSWACSPLQMLWGSMRAEGEWSVAD